LQLFYQPSVPDGVHHLDPDESRHAVKVLRLREGDLLNITDGKGCFYDAQIVRAELSQCTFSIVNTRVEAPKKFRIHIAIAPTKNTDRIEWFVEKAVELGIDQISFILCANSERKSLKMDRLEKVAISAMKQSQQAWLPKLLPVVPFNNILTTSSNQRFIALVDTHNPRHLNSAARAGGEYLVLIGPEGDFSPDELQSALGSGFLKVSLGNTRLRTETAGLAACHILNLINL
jgi:16S rRNA (uracil1498-N3)-methyltransferase